MERLVQKLIMSEINPYCKIEGIPDEFYVANGEEASFEQLQVVQEALKKLYEYEQMEEQGLIMKLPCKVGDNIWWFNKGKLIESKVISFSVNKDGVERIYVKYFYYIGINPFCAYGIEVKEFGKSVFLTKEEAEKALKEMEKENDNR